MLELRLEKTTLLKDIVEALSDLSSVANFDFSGTGLELQAIDPRRVALAVLILPAKAFTYYHCDRDLSVGLNLTKMAKAFRCANNDDIVTIKFVEDGFDIVTLAFESPEYGQMSYVDFDSLCLNGLPFEIKEFPQSDYQAIVRISSDNFMRICKKLSTFSDSADRDPVVFISVDKEGVVEFSTWAGTTAIVCRGIDIIGKPKEPILAQMKKDVSLMFDLRCMNSFSKVSTLSDQVTISLSSELPAVFEHKIAEMGYVRYYIMSMKEKERQDEGDEMQWIAMEDKMQNEGDEMHN